MNGTISRDAAINKIEQAKVRVFHSVERAIGRSIVEILDDVEKDIRGLPSAEPQIIQCKDCKYAEYIDDVKTLWCTECGQGRTVAPDDYCSYAERRWVTT